MAHIYGLPLVSLTLVLEVPTGKYAQISCYILEFPLTFIKLHGDIRVKNWNQMQNAEDLGWILSIRNTHVLHI